MNCATRGSSSWLPDYTIRESARAKYVRFSVSPVDGLTVVIPRGFDRRRISALLRDKRPWLERTLAEAERQRGETLRSLDPPAALELAALGQTWTIVWIPSLGTKLTIEEPDPFVLRMTGPIGDPSAWRPALRTWLTERARDALVPWVHEIAHDIGVPLRRVTVRCQKTRWGSYTTCGAINLNVQLLFLPRSLARYVLVHEVCHGVHTDHSPAFWQFVRQWDPQAQDHRAQLRRAGPLVPQWLRRDV